MATFPDAAWFEALGRRMAERRETFERLGYAETRFAIRVIGDGGPTRTVGLVLEGYGLASAEDADDVEAFDPDFVVCAPAPVWERMLDEIRVNGRPTRLHTLNSLVLVGDEMWLESTDQLRENRFYRFNQTLQELFNLASDLDAEEAWPEMRSS